jgi:hypothetical protein
VKLSVISGMVLATLTLAQAQEQRSTPQPLVTALEKHDAVIAGRFTGETKAQKIQASLVMGLLKQAETKALRFDEAGARELVAYFGKIGEQVARPDTAPEQLTEFQGNQKRFFAAFLREASDIAAGESLGREKVDRILSMLPRKYAAQGRCWPFW